MRSACRKPGRTTDGHDRGSRLRAHAPDAVFIGEAALGAEPRRSAAGRTRAAGGLRPRYPLQRLGPERGYDPAHTAATDARRRRDADPHACQSELPAPAGTVAVLHRRRAAGRGRDHGRHRQGGAALAEPRAVQVPALGDHEARRADARGLVPARPAAAAGLSVAVRPRAVHRGARGSGRGRAGPRHCGADRRERRTAGADGGAVAAHHRGPRAARCRCRDAGLELPARLPAHTRADLPESPDRSARRRLPHHPEPDRARLGRRVRQGLDERQPGAARVPARALDGLHLRGGRRGIRAGRPGAADHAVPVHREPRGVARNADQRHVLPAAGPEPGADVLRLRVHQRRHGQRTAASGRRTVAARELWRNLGGHAAGRLRDSDGPVFAPQAGRHVSTALRIARLLALGAFTLAQAAAPEPPGEPASPGGVAHFDTSRPEIRSFIDQLVAQGFEREQLATLLAAAPPHPRIIDEVTRPAEKVLQWWEYRARMLTSARIEAGAQLWREHKELLDQVATEYQVEPEYLIAVLGVETQYGRITGRYRVIDALATLGFDYPPRAT